MTAEWVVVIETVGEGSSVMTIDGVRRLMELMAERNPTTLYSPDRYALQIVVPAHSAQQALADALATWQEAQRELNVDGWQLVRAEVITEAEFERDADRRRRELASTEASDEKELEEDLLRQAFHDPTTGLAGRALFVNHLRHELLRIERIHSQLALVLLELGTIEVPEHRDEERFRGAVLSEVANRLTRLTRNHDCVARVGDLRFAVLLDGTGEQVASEVAARLLSGMRTPVLVGNDQVALAVRVGVATSDTAETAECMMRQAEVALQRASRTSSAVGDPAHTPTRP